MSTACKENSNPVLQRVVLPKNVTDPTAEKEDGLSYHPRKLSIYKEQDKLRNSREH